MKTMEFLYQENEIHFALQNEGNVMINATEMAKMFNKRIDHFLKADHTKKFIEHLEKDYAQFPPYGGNETPKILVTNRNLGTFMSEALALKFAAWLDVEFEVWVYKKIQEVIFGNYKKHWEAHAIQEAAKVEMETLKKEMLTNSSLEANRAYFEAEKRMKDAKNSKTKAIRHQYRLFNGE